MTYTLEDALNLTLSLKAPEGWRGSKGEVQATLNAQSALTYLTPKCRIENLTLDQLQEYASWLEVTGVSDATINRKMSALSKILNVALRHGKVKSIPPMPKQRREPVGRERVITPEEQAEMCSYWNETGRPDMADFVTVLIETGMRVSELKGVSISDISFPSGMIRVTGGTNWGTKNGTFRSVPMTDECHETLLRQVPGINGGFKVFEGLTTHDLRKLWRGMKEHLGLEDDKDLVMHACRHTCASRLVQGGVPLTVVKEWLGHKSINVTMRYAHLHPQDLMNAAKVLGQRKES